MTIPSDDDRDEREYGPDGLYRYGPQLRRNPLADLIVSPTAPPPAPPPAVARAQQQLQRRRARTAVEGMRRLVAALQADATPRRSAHPNDRAGAPSPTQEPR